jgi:hypothetical protein
VEDGDHGFAKTSGTSGAAIASMLDRVVAWFFSEPFDQNGVVWPVARSPDGVHGRVNTVPAK